MAELELRREQLTGAATVAVVAIAVVAVYARSLPAPFIFDDLNSIVENPSLERLWPPIGDAARPGPLNPPRLAPTSRRPLVNLTFALDRRIAGLDPRWYRALNVLLHAVTALMLAAVVRRTLALPYFSADVPKRAAERLAVAVALLWAVHPLNTETVAYVTQRTEILAGLAYLTALWAAILYRTADRHDGRRWLVASALAFLAGVASKEVVVSMPFVFWLYERTFLPDVAESRFRSWPVYASFIPGFVLLALLNVSGFGGLSDARHHVAWPVWWMTQAKVLLLYLKLVVWPWPLSIHYAPAYLPSVAAAWPWLLATTALAVGAAAWSWRRPAARVPIVAALLALAPTLIVPLPKMMAAERRMYLPLAALVCLVVIGGYRAVARRLQRSAERAVLATATVLVLAAATVSIIRLGAYASAETIWRDAVAHQPGDAMAHYNLGVALLEGGHADDALAELETALRLDPEHTGALDNVGVILDRRGRSDDAMAYYRRALLIEPDDVTALNNLGGVLTKVGRPNEAIPHLQRALALASGKRAARVQLNLGQAERARGGMEEGLAHLKEAVRIAPDDADARYALGAALLVMGRSADAIDHLEHALRLEPDDAQAHDTLASAFLQTGHGEQAVAHYRQALVLQPEDVETRSNLGTALLTLGRRTEAIAELEHAVRAKPDYANARYNLGSALLEDGRPGDAVPHLEAAADLMPTDAHVRFKCALAYAGAEQRARAIAQAEEARALARTQHDGPLLSEIERWLDGYRRAAAG
jgi:tetratricopeptide (TPR) repeat protein